MVVCTACSASKSRCDRATPCQRCDRRGLHCTYTRSNGEAQQQQQQRSVASNSRSTPSLSFLLDSSDPTKAMPLFVEEGAERDDEQKWDWTTAVPALSVGEGELHLSQFVDQSFYPWLWPYTEIGGSLCGIAAPTVPLVNETTAAILAPEDNDIRHLRRRLEMLSDELKLLGHETPWTNHADMICRETPPNFVQIFFGTIQWPCSLLHPATFDIRTTGIPLLLTVALTASFFYTISYGPVLPR